MHISNIMCRYLRESALKIQRLKYTIVVVRSLTIAILCGSLITPGVDSGNIRIGANAFDLLLQFTGYASGGDGSAPWLNLTRAMGGKSILDARDAGFEVLRIAAAGYGPNSPEDSDLGALGLWLTNSTNYWAKVDGMFEALDQARMHLVPSFIWNATQFPTLGHDTMTDFLRDPNSRSATLVQQYITEFVTRYRERDTILFYEMGNELNLLTELDLVGRCRLAQRSAPNACAAVGNVSTEDLLAFSKRIVELVHRLDPARKISSGFANPRPAAAHLIAQPEWSTKGPDWTPDSLMQFASLLHFANAPFDIVSLHLYNDNDTIRSDLGTTGPASFARLVAQLVHSSNKHLFVGEFADPERSALERDIGLLLRDGTVDIAALWVWELYQSSPTRTPESARYDVEPGYREEALASLSEVLITPKLLPKPRVVLTSPLPCSSLDNPVTLQAVASVGATVPLKVEFLLDGKLLGIASRFPYRLLFDPRGHSPAVAYLTARAIATNGAIADVDVPVKLNGTPLDCRV